MTPKERRNPLARLTKPRAARLAVKLRTHGILSEKDVAVLSEGTLALLRENFSAPSGVFSIASIAESFRFGPVAKRCVARREAQGISIQEVARLLRVPQYRLKAVELGRLREVDPLVLRKYVEHLGLSSWFRDWARQNRELAERLGAIDGVQRGRPNNQMHLTRSAPARNRGPRR